MRFRAGFFSLFTFALSTSVFALGVLPGAGAPANFNLASKTQVPGQVLKPGAYTIHVVDHIEDRIVVEVDGANGKEHDLFLAVPTTTGLVGPVAWQKGSDGTQALKGFNFANGLAVEFVYPKAAAVALAKANGTPVIAVDPESEAKPKVAKMSADDRRMVTLWLLSITKTGPNEKTSAVLAKRYQAPDHQQGIEAKNSSRRAVGETAGRGSALPANETASVGEPAMPPVREVAPRPKRKPVIAELPHTASDVPLIGLLGFGALFAACTLMLRRRFSL
jgi:hypothetical protein